MSLTPWSRHELKLPAPPNHLTSRPGPAHGRLEEVRDFDAVGDADVPGLS